ncbi:MAG: DNA mismatch repair endonuclease MutL [Planctomycetota bacterium]
MPIRKLSPLLINQIAAGEVIERPASVVKELVDNALDAGASSIEVAVEEGGTRLVRVRDDGKGVPAGEMGLALEQHATSKVAEPGDLERVGTLGFRGEALASIASVSRLRMTSRVRGESAGAAIEMEGAAGGGVEPVGCGFGTVVEVRDLFFNVPARRKFLRSPGTEMGHISDTVQRLAMTHAGVGFRLSHNGRVSLDLPTGQGRVERAVALLGKDLAEGLIPFEEEVGGGAGGAGGAKVWGLAGEPSLARATGKAQHLTVNGRPVKDRNLQHAMREAYRGLIPPDKFPLVVVMVELDPSEVDVNVHPAKSEVRFRNAGMVHGLVLNGLRRALLAKDLTPKAGFGRNASGFAVPVLTPTEPVESDAAPGAFVDYFKRMDPTQKGLVFEEVKREMAEAEPERLMDQAGQEQPVPVGVSAAERVLQVHNSYVVTEDDHGILIVDQHALHERVMFERLRARIIDQEQALESQRLLVPTVVDVDPGREVAAEQLAWLVGRLGIELEPFGRGKLAVQAFPSLLFDRGVEPGAFIEELLDKGQAGAFDDGKGGSRDATVVEAALSEVLDMMSCKAAVKAGDKLSDGELAELLKQRDQIERSSNCPHGRPTTLRLTLKDLERQFGRS